MKIRKRLRDKVDFWCLARIGLLLFLGWVCFDRCLGFYRIVGDGFEELRDGDLVVYEKIWKHYGYDDVVLYEKNGEKIAKMADANGGVIKGRVLVLLRVRDIVDE